MTFAARTQLGSAVFTPVTHIYSPGSGVETIPVGATKLTVELGQAGAGGGANAAAAPSGGGGGGLARTAVIPLTSANWGQTINWDLAFGGLGAPAGNNNGDPPAISNVSSGTFTTAVNLVASQPTGGASFGTPAGIGGTVSGGAVNTPGNNGQTGNAGGNGGAAISGIYVNSGAGGRGNEGAPGNPGGNAAVAFAYA
jgi:hypothetical protein